MDNVKLGALSVSRLGFGCYAVGGAYGPAEAGGVRGEPGKWEPLIRRAYELGVNFFDTAEIYGDAEAILGRAVRPFRDRVAIASKVGVSPSGERDASPAHVAQACERSLARLGTGWIDLYQIHFDDPATPVADTIGALEDLKDKGKIREYGVGHIPLAKVRDYVRLGHPASALFELSAVARSVTKDLLPYLRSSGVGGIAFSPTGRGLLTGAVTAQSRFDPSDIRSLDPLFSRERRASGLRVKEKLAEIGLRHARSPAQVAIAWVLAQPGVTAALTGPTNPAHLEENLVAADWPFPREEREALDLFLEEEDGRTREATLETCRGILGGDLDRSGADPYASLLYVLETAVQYGLAGEEEVMPVVVRLLGLRKQAPGGPSKASAAVLEELRSELKGILGNRFGPG